MPCSADSEADQRSSRVRRSRRKVPAWAASSASKSSSGLRPPSGSVPYGAVMVVASCASSQGELIGRRPASLHPTRPGTIQRVDAFAALELAPDAPPQEIGAAYRRLAKRWHPDRGGGAAAVERMAEINAAYDVLRAGAWQREPPPQDAVSRVPMSPSVAGAWLPEPLRRALGRELLVALEEAEDFALVTPAATWA